MQRGTPPAVIEFYMNKYMFQPLYRYLGIDSESSVLFGHMTGKKNKIHETSYHGTTSYRNRQVPQASRIAKCCNRTRTTRLLQPSTHSTHARIDRLQDLSVGRLLIKPFIHYTRSQISWWSLYQNPPFIKWDRTLCLFSSSAGLLSVTDIITGTS